MNDEVLLDHDWLKVIREDVRFPNGTVIQDFLTVERPDYAAVVPLLDKDHLLLVEQYRHGLRDTIMNLPMGRLEEGEPPIETARRELLEETGYAAQHITPVGAFANAPSFLRLTGHLFIAEQLVPKQARHDPLEEVRVVTVTFDEAKDLISRGKITDMTTIIGIQHVLLQINPHQFS